LSAWLIAGWIIVLFIVVTIWFNISWARMQRRVAKQRPGLKEAEYIQEFAASGVNEEIALALYTSLLPHCVKRVLPHPDDGLIGFYFDDPEDLEDMLEELYLKLSLIIPEQYDQLIAPALESVRHLGVFLQTKLDPS
jgi:hypothetical protein